MREDTPQSADGPRPEDLPATPETAKLVLEVTEEALDALYGRVTALHDAFKRDEFIFRVRLGKELLDTLFQGRYAVPSTRACSKTEPLSRFYGRYRDALDARDLREEALRRCVRVAEMVPNPTALPEHVTFSHLLELVALPRLDQAWFLKHKLKKPIAVKELREAVRRRLAEIRAKEIEAEEAAAITAREDEDDGAGDDNSPVAPRRYVGNVPRRVDAVLNEALSVSRDLAPEVLKRPEVAGEALEKWLKVKQAADWWVEVLTKGGE